MSYAAVIHLIRDFRNTEFIVDDQFFYPLNFVEDDYLRCNTGRSVVCFRENSPELVEEPVLA